MSAVNFIVGAEEQALDAARLFVAVYSGRTNVSINGFPYLIEPGSTYELAEVLRKNNSNTVQLSKEGTVVFLNNLKDSNQRNMALKVFGEDNIQHPATGGGASIKTRDIIDCSQSLSFVTRSNTRCFIHFYWLMIPIEVNPEGPTNITAFEAEVQLFIKMLLCKKSSGEEAWEPPTKWSRTLNYDELCGVIKTAAAFVGRLSYAAFPSTGKIYACIDEDHETVVATCESIKGSDRCAIFFSFRDLVLITHQRESSELKKFNGIWDGVPLMSKFQEASRQSFHF